MRGDYEKRKKLRRCIIRPGGWLALAAALALLFSVFFPAFPAAAAVGGISLYVTDGPVGTPNALTGSGFTPGSTYSVRFATTVLSTGVVGSDGELSADFAVPAYPGGQYEVKVTTAYDTSNTEYFLITPEITLDTAVGRAGSQVRVSGSGFRASSTVSIYFDGTISMGAVIASSSGTITNALLTIPVSSGGKHTIKGKDAYNTSPEVNFTVLQPEASLNRSTGYVGAQIAVSGKGFKPSSSVSILFDNLPVGNAVTDTAGALSNVLVTVPHSSQGPHKVSIKDAIGISSEATFNTLPPEITLSQDSGRVDDQPTVSGFGFKPNSSASILFDGAVISASVMADGTGAFSGAVITIPPASGGKHIISARDTLNVSAGVNFEIKQSMMVSPPTGAVGDVVQVSGSGFSKNSAVTVEFDYVAIKTNTSVDASGTFTGSFAVPESAAGKHTIHVRDGSGNENDVTFSVLPGISISPETGPPGTIANVKGTGFGANTAVTLKYNGMQLAMNPAQVKTDSKGSFFASFEVPASLPGSYSVEADDSVQVAGAKFTALLSATISQITTRAAPGHVGMKLNIDGVGFSPNAKITVTRATIQKPLATAQTSGQGIFSVEFIIPPSPSGEHRIIVTDGVNTREFEFFIEEEAPLSPSLLLPETGTKAKQPLFFDWNDVTDPSGITYTLQIARDERFENVFMETKGLGNSEFELTGDGLEAVTSDNPYYWRVKAVDGAFNESEWSEVRKFSTGLVLTLPNGEDKLIVSAWAVYGIVVFILSLLFLSFIVGRKSAPF